MFDNFEQKSVSFLTKFNCCKFLLLFQQELTFYNYLTKINVGKFLIEINFRNRYQPLSKLIEFFTKIDVCSFLIKTN